MAVDLHTPPPTRRGMLATGVALAALPAAAAGGAGSIPTHPGPDPDAALVALAQRWRTDWAAVDAVCDRLAAAEAASDARGEAEAQRDFGVLFASIAALEERIADLPAHGVAGLAVKGALLARIYLGPTVPQDRHDRLARTLAADARRLVPCAAGVEA